MPTNIRAEGWAIVKALELAQQKIPSNVSVRIYSDSHFWIVDMVTQYIPDWIENDVAFTDKKNSDIVGRIWDLVQKLNNVRFVFVRAWHDRKQPAADTDDYYHWNGNRLAERTAERSLGLIGKA